MWTISGVKERGRAAFKGNYWKCVLVAFLLTLFMGIGSMTVGNSMQSATDEQQEMSADELGSEAYKSLTDISGELASESDLTQAQADMIVGGVTGAMLAAIMGAVMIFMIVGSILKILVVNPLEVGCKNFFLKNSRMPANLDEIGGGFSCWLRNVLAMFLKGLFLALWFCLFVIPGFIKLYSYRMVPYVLADNPEMSALEAITESRRLMNGSKFRTFLLDLSFIGWILLELITCGIVGVFWVNPYLYSTEAQLYLELKENAPAA